MSSEQEIPEAGEIVLATITKIGDHGAYVTLDEYQNLQGFLHVSEIAPGWVRNVGRYVKEGEKKVLLVKKIHSGRKEIDLSLKQISKEQRKNKLLDVKKNEKSQGILNNIQEKSGLEDNEIEELEDKLLVKFDSVYDAFREIAISGTEILDELKISKKSLQIIDDVASRIKLPSVEIRGILELTDKSSDGVENIKKILLGVTKKAGVGVEISYLGAPKYRLCVLSQDFKSAEKKLKPILSDIEKGFKKNNSEFSFLREESKKIGEG